MKQKSLVGIALGLACVSFITLSFFTSSLPHDGIAAMTLVQHLDILPLPSFANPVYGWIVKGIAVVAEDSVVYAVNLFSVLCASGLLALVFLLVYRSTRSFNIEHSLGPAEMHRIQLVAGLFSVLYLVASGPFALAATRAGPLAFDLLIVLFSLNLVLSCTRSNHSFRLPLAALLYGISMVEFNTAILFAPLFGVIILSTLWKLESFTAKSILVVVAAGTTGLLLYIIQAGFYMATPAYEWRGFTSFFEVIRYIWIEQYQALTLSLPRVGWLSLSLVSFLPWLITMSLRKSNESGRTRGALMGTCALYAMFGVLAILLLLDFPLSPVSLTGKYRLFVTPYIFIALWVGNISAFWLAILFRKKRFENAAFTKAKRTLAIMILVGVPVYLLFMAAFRSLPQTQTHEDTVIRQFAAQIIEESADKEWLITNTPVDDLISLEAYLRGLPLKIIRLAQSRSTVYMKYVSTLFENDSRLESLALIGITPLLDEMFVRIPNAERHIAVVQFPDLWMGVDMFAIPERVVFSGKRSLEGVDVDAILKSNQAFWDDFGGRLMAEDVNLTSGAGPTIKWMRTHMSKLANNLGVFLEDQARSDDAFACYKQAREFDPDNISALMNMHVIAEREGRPEFEALAEELKSTLEKHSGRIQAVALSFVYGFVRVPELFANRGMAFAMSGKANMAISDLKKSLELKKNNPQVQMALAGVYFSQEKEVESRQYYEEVLANSPGNSHALLGLLRVAVKQGDAEVARGYLNRLKQQPDVDQDLLKLEEAVLEVVAGSPALAMKLLQAVVAKKPDNMKAWAAIAITATQLNDAKTSATAMARLREAKALSPSIQLIMAQSALDLADRDGALMYLKDILRSQPENVKALEMMLRIYLSEGNRDQVQKTVEQILTIDRSNALANYMLGVHHYYNEEYALAESSYRASLATRRSPETLNDLAYVLYVQNQYEEAEVLIRESIALDNRNGAAWDTLGVILMNKGQLKEAEDALLKSLALRPGTASVTLSLALLYEKQERWEDLAKLTNEILTRMNELPPSEHAVLRDLQQRQIDRN